MKSAKKPSSGQIRGILFGAIILLAGCFQAQPQRDIYGKWRADKFTMGAVGIPIAPNMDFDSDKAVIGGSPSEVESYVREGDRITVHLKSGISLTFEMQGKDAMTADVPIIGKTRYSRVK